MRQIVVDTETTGLQPAEGHRIIEIGCIELVNRKFTGKRYHQYMNPLREVEEGALAVHGISNQFLKDKPLFSDIVEDLMAFIAGAELIIHNAPFDVGFINHELNLLDGGWKPLADYCHVIDTLVIARQLHIGQKNSLDALCKRYAIDNSKRDLHGALLDAHLLAHVYLAMTGGQSSLFDEASLLQWTENHEIEKPEMIVAKRTAGCLSVITANREEMVEHEQLLQLIKQQGKCLWVD
jgi:DNA polymerase-3 subunit epsilon